MQNYAWVIYALVGAFLAAVVSVLSKRALERSHFTVALTVQSCLMVLTLATAMLIARRTGELFKLSASTALLLIAAGVAAGMSWFCGYRALQLSHVASATPIDKLSLPIGVILAMIFLRERPSALNWFGIVLMLVGALFVAKTKTS